ncbi:MAG: DUF3795 domain-containing protein [bacterium]
MRDRTNDVAPCGVFCAACPSLNKSCFGCASENRNQSRKSKWTCKIRECCYEKMKIDYCGYCNDFPCNLINKKLIKSYEGDSRFKYRHEIPANLEQIKLLGIDEFIKTKKKEYICEHCGGSACFYYYKCNQCGAEIPK